MSNKPLILGVNGSSRKRGRVATMLARALGQVEKHGGRTRTIHLADYQILPHSGRLDPKTILDSSKDDMRGLIRLVLDADGIIFASPTHWFAMSSLMKLFLDRLTNLEHYNFLMEGKVAGFIAYGPQGGALNSAMLMTMITNHMGMSVPPYAAIFDEGRGDEWLRREYGVLAKNMLQQIKAWKTLELNWGYPGNKYKISPVELLPRNFRK